MDVRCVRADGHIHMGGQSLKWNAPSFLNTSRCKMVVLGLARTYPTCPDY
jgi:hypothetical protein